MRAFFRIKSRATAENNFAIIEILLYTTIILHSIFVVSNDQDKNVSGEHTSNINKLLFRNIPETASFSNNSEIKNLLRK